MFGQSAWKLRLAVFVALSAATAAWAADDDDVLPPTPKRQPWVNTWFTPKPRPSMKPKKTPPKEAAKEPAKKSETQVEAAQVKRQKELADYLRRLAVCDQLTQVAYETRDDELLKQVNQVKDRVWLTYKLRTVGPRNHPETEEQILERHLGPTASVDGQEYEPLLGTDRSAEAKSRTAFKEEYRR